MTLPLGREQTMTMDVLRGEQCAAWLAKTQARDDWNKLYGTCPWATAFLSASFFAVWTGHYGAMWEPVLVTARRAGDLVGLMPLARRQGIVTGVGAHQAEYHGWISNPEDAARFLASALEALHKTFSDHRIVLHYLPPQLPKDVAAIAQGRGRIRLAEQRCAFMDVDAPSIDETLRKKGNKSKLNRLKREGEVVVRMLSPEELRRHIDAIAAFCDFRQGAINDSCPFLDDPLKRDFHTGWASAAPEQLQSSAMFVGGRLASAVLSVRSGATAHIAILAYAPEYAIHSINKLHLYMAARDMVERGVTAVDMTPGGEWKERFGTRTETVTELISYPTKAQAWRASAPLRIRAAVLDIAAALGLTREKLRTIKASVLVKTAMPPAIDARARLLVREPGPLPVEPLGAMKVNALGDLVRWISMVHRRRRAHLLAVALENMEAGALCYSLSPNGGATQALWAEKYAHNAGASTVDGTLLRDFDAPTLNASSTEIVKLTRAALAASASFPTFARVKVDDGEARATLEALGFKDVTMV